MPLRLALIGLHSAALTDSSDAKPATVKVHSESAPPVTTASHNPILIRRAALAMALALDEQALECTYAGPATPSSRASITAGEPISWRSYWKSSGNTPCVA